MVTDMKSSDGALSFISKGWREVRDSADADLQLIRSRTSSIRVLAKSIDKELENLMNSASIFPVTSMGPSSSVSWSSPGDMDIVKRLQPKLREFRTVYSSSEFWRRVLEKWPTSTRIKINLARIKNAIVTDLGERSERSNPNSLKQPSRGRHAHGLDSRSAWKVSVKKLMNSFWESGSLNSPSEIFQLLGSTELVGRVKSAWMKICKESRESMVLHPRDIIELFAFLLRQSEPVLDQFRAGRELRDKVMCRQWRRSKNTPPLDGLSGDDQMNDDMPARHVAIVTTASLPWMTGTAVNPLFRAAYLAKSTDRKVTLMIPWLSLSDQELVYPENLLFHSPEDQEAYIRSWLEDRADFKPDFKITFYPAKFSKERRSIIPSGDVSRFIPRNEANVAILEEPEHLNWYHHGTRWTDKFDHVVGVVHTNYLEYVRRERHGALHSPLVELANNWVTRAHCHRVVRLSAATQEMPRSVVCNVHGVGARFLEIGDVRRDFAKGAYFLGKMVWAKGYRELLDLVSRTRLRVDVFGAGDDAAEVRAAAVRLRLDVRFLGAADHADDALRGYKVFVNPSLSDVVCTATAEALAMGKFVVCADHPSNDFFRSFPNCLTYGSPAEFALRVRQALDGDPLPLTPEQRYELSWEAATERLVRCSGLRTAPDSTAAGRLVDAALAFGHHFLTGIELVRVCSGGIPGTRDYDVQQSSDLHLPPPPVHTPYDWSYPTL